MAITLTVPDSVSQSLRLPEAEVEQRLRVELAIILYGQDLLGLGKAAAWAGVTRFEFAEWVAERGLPRHYGLEELADDLRYARSE